MLEVECQGAARGDIEQVVLVSVAFVAGTPLAQFAGSLQDFVAEVSQRVGAGRVKQQESAGG